VLATLGSFYDSEIDASIKNMVTLIEPLMLIILGGIVGLIALSVIIPIYQLIGQF
jgi:type IV pilus assembly protein PilC